MIRTIGRGLVVGLAALTPLLGVAVVSVAGPAVSVAYAADDEEWGPGDRIFNPNTGYTGTVTQTGQSIAWDDLPWNSAQQLWRVKADGGVKVGHID